MPLPMMAVLSIHGLARQPKPALFKVQQMSYSKEGIACMLPQDEFLAFSSVLYMSADPLYAGFLDRQRRKRPF